jgi:hypothetical protein
VALVEADLNEMPARRARGRSVFEEVRYVKEPAMSSWRALQLAMRHEVPACIDDPRFTDVSAGRRTNRQLQELCAQCPMLVLCQAYADADRPPGGFWAGQRFN